MFATLRANLRDSFRRPADAGRVEPSLRAVSPYDRLRQNQLVHTPEGAPYFYPDPWDDMRDHFNCYSYALRLMGHGWSRPGQLVTREADHRYITPTTLNHWLSVDGLERIHEHNGDYLRDHIIAAFVTPIHLDGERIDYHFYSLDRDGTWSHKLGDSEATKLDSNGRTIHDPLQAARYYRSLNRRQNDLDYSQFVGFYRIPDEGIVYDVAGPLSYLMVNGP